MKIEPRMSMRSRSYKLPTITKDVERVKVWIRGREFEIIDDGGQLSIRTNTLGHRLEVYPHASNVIRVASKAWPK